MLVIQHNCRKSYPITIAAFEAGLTLNATFICLQEPYIGIHAFNHPGYDIRWPEKGNTSAKRVLIAIKKDILPNIVIENRSDLINHPYFLVIDIWDLSKKKTKIRRTRLINCYDQKIGPGTAYQDSDISRRAIQDIVDWSPLLNGRTIFMGDFNAHSPYWNPLISSSQNGANHLEEIIDRYNLILNNEPGVITRPNSTNNQSIIDLTFTTMELGPLESWAIEEENSTPSDHELIIFNWHDIDQNTSNNSEITGWDIDRLCQDSEKLKEAKDQWLKLIENRRIVNISTTKEGIEAEALFIEDSITLILNKNAKSLRITAFSKRWWNEEIQKARLKYSQCRRELKFGLKDNSTLKRLKTARNNYYQMIRREKQKCWQAFLEGDDISENITCQKSANRCWTALKYTSPRNSSQTPAMKAPNGSIATTIEEKELIFLNSAFPTPIINSRVDETANLAMENEISNAEIQETDIENAIFQQSVKKAPGPDKLNFKAIRLLWQWDKARIIALITQCFNRGYHPKNWKIAKGIILAKPNKPDKSIPKAYRVISLLNCLGKVVERLAANQISSYCERNELLHEGQFGCRRGRSTIDAVAELIYTTEKAWEDKKLVGALFMDVKGAFDYVNKEQLLKRMRELNIPNYLINWTNSFLIDRRVQLVIDGFTCPTREITTGVPQGSPVSPILFIIYLSGIFDNIELELSIKALSFADDIAFLASAKTVSEIQITLEKAGERAIEWGLLNNVSFDVDKTEAVLFTKSKKIRRNIKDYKMTINSHDIFFNSQATRWLGIWLDSNLSFKEHYQKCFLKANQAEKRLKSISKTHGLASGLVRRVQLALVQSIALYGAEIWWKGQKNAAEKLQKIINSQGRAITGALTTSPIDLIVENAHISPAEPLLDDRQRKYAFRGLKQAISEPLNSLLPPTLRYGDELAQTGQFSDNNLQWVDYQAKTRNISQRLAKKLTSGLNFDSSKGFETAYKVENRQFKGEITISDRDKALQEVQQQKADLNLFTDGSRHENGRCGAAICWKKPTGEYQGKGIAMGERKEVFDAELMAIFESLKIAKKEAKRNDYKTIIIFSDSQQAIERCRNDKKGPGQALAIEIIAETDFLMDQGLLIHLHWVPAHSGIEGNEKADQLTKTAVNKPKNINIDGYSSFSFTNRLIREEKKNSIRKWLYEKRTRREKRETTEKPLSKLNKHLFSVKKSISSRYFQLKMGHAITAEYLYRIKRLENKCCWFCSNRNQSIEHLIFECPKWRKQREELFHQLTKKGLPRPRIKDKSAKNRLFDDPKALEAILAFIESTEIGQRPRNHEEEEERILYDIDEILGDWGID